MRAPAGASLVLVTVAACCAALASGCFGGSSSSEDATPTPDASVPSTPPEEVLRLYVDRRLFAGFVPDCEDAVRPDDIGKQCARRLAERDGLLAYQLGPAFSEYTRLIILKPIGDTWTIAHLEERDANEPPPPGIPWPIQIGANLVVAGTAPDCLRIRSTPGLRSPELACIDDGVAATVVSGPVEVDSIEWWQLEGYGWAAASYLRYPDEATPAPTEE